MDEVVFHHRGFSVRPWKCADRDAAADVVRQCLESYGLNFEPEGADLDTIEVEFHYWNSRSGEFWVVVEEDTNRVVGTAAYYEIQEGENGWENVQGRCVEVRRMYLLPEARGKQLGRTLLQVSRKRIWWWSCRLCTYRDWKSPLQEKDTIRFTSRQLQSYKRPVSFTGLPSIFQ